MSGRIPRTLSFTALQLLASKLEGGCDKADDELIQFGPRTSSSESVGKRLDRVEPRDNKRRPKLLALLTKPRRIAQQNRTHAA